MPAKRNRLSLSSLRRDELISRLAGIYVLLDQLERGLHELMTRRENGILPEVRAEIMDLYAPLLQKMIELGLRP